MKTFLKKKAQTSPNNTVTTDIAKHCPECTADQASQAYTLSTRPIDRLID